MKKIGLICAILLAGGSLTACGNNQQSKSSKMDSLKAEHSSLIAESKKQNKKVHKGKQHIKKSSKSSSKSSIKKDDHRAASSSKNTSTKQATQSNSNSNQAAKDSSSATSSISSNASSNNHNNSNSSNGNNYDATDSYNGDPNRYRNGTRKPSTFSNSQDYQAYVAYYQGYNYDKSTGQLTRMNDQQLNDMRQQMNQNGGANFGQGDGQ